MENHSFRRDFFGSCARVPRKQQEMQNSRRDEANNVRRSCFILHLLNNCNLHTSTHTDPPDLQENSETPSTLRYWMDEWNESGRRVRSLRWLHRPYCIYFQSCSPFYDLNKIVHRSLARRTRPALVITPAHLQRDILCYASLVHRVGDSNWARHMEIMLLNWMRFHKVMNPIIGLLLLLGSHPHSNPNSIFQFHLDPVPQDRLVGGWLSFAD